MTKPTYRAEDGKVWKNPIVVVNDDNSRSVTVGFPVCTMTEYASKDAARNVAGLMNRGELYPAMLEALKAARKRISIEMTHMIDRAVLEEMGEELSQIDAALAAAEPETEETR